MLYVAILRERERERERERDYSSPKSAQEKAICSTYTILMT